MNKKYLRFEQMDVFRPMPVSDALKEQIRQEADRAKAMAKESGLDKVRQLQQPTTETRISSTAWLRLGSRT